MTTHLYARRKGRVMPCCKRLPEQCPGDKRTKNIDLVTCAYYWFTPREAARVEAERAGRATAFAKHPQAWSLALAWHNLLLLYVGVMP